MDSVHDIIVVGGGAAGLVTAAGSAGIGARVALVERERLGGECLWNGCVPSKALLACARAANDARDAGRFGVDVRDVRVDFERAMRHVREAQARIEPNDSPARFRGLGVDVIEGEARFVGPRALQVGDRVLRAKRVVIATGSRPAVPTIPGLDTVPYLTNETLFALTALPATLLVLGGGPIGVEMAQAFARLGSTVHLITTAPQLLDREDAELAEMLTVRLRAEGVQVHLETTVTRAERGASGARLIVRSGGAEQTLDGDALLVAVGREARTDTLDLAAGGVETAENGIRVDATLRTSADGVWAAGDCVGPLRFTHVADQHARLVIRNAFFPFASKLDSRVVPWVTFADPELARVGLTEREARERHGDGVRVWRRPVGESDRAIADGRTDGLVKLVTDARGRILGGHVLAYGAGNLIGEIVLAMKHGIGAGALGATMHAYPTYPELVKQAAEGYTKARFTGTAKKLARWFARR